MLQLKLKCLHISRCTFVADDYAQGVLVNFDQGVHYPTLCASVAQDVL